MRRTWISVHGLEEFKEPAAAGYPALQDLEPPKALSPMSAKIYEDNALS